MPNLAWWRLAEKDCLGGPYQIAEDSGLVDTCCGSCLRMRSPWRSSADNPSDQAAKGEAWVAAGAAEAAARAG